MADDSTLFKAVNNWASNLTNGINDTTTTITLDSVVGLPTTGGVLTFTDNKEIIHYTSISGNDLTVTRGYDNTTAAAHSAGVRVEMRSIAAHHNVLKDEILSLDENQRYTESPMVVSGGEITEGTNSQWWRNNRGNKCRDVQGSSSGCSIEGYRFGYRRTCKGY